MKNKIILVLALGLSGLIFANQPNIPALVQDTTKQEDRNVAEDKFSEQKQEQEGEIDTLKTEDDYQVEKKSDDWLETWETIKPKVKDFFSDEPGEELEYRDEDRPHKRKRGKHGFFNGAAIGWHWEFVPTDFDALNDYGLNNMDLDQINTNIGRIGIDEHLDNTIYMRGFGGWVFLGKNIRVGGYGGQGKLVTNDVLPDKPNLSREVEFKLNSGGLLIEKVYHPFNNSEIYFGGTIGRSHVKIKISQNASSTSWDDVWNNDKLENDFRVNLESKYFSITPSVGVRYNLWHWLGIGAKVGYYYGKPNQWKINGGKLVSVPDMDFSNVVWGVNLYLGG
ncbi:MAG: hypothetical protein K9M80_03120 [Candidatus Marinimicrobia bacterium]|nr:hypothetical protein [Candidatus Neomarinimicrobiota bacterium]